MTAVGLDFSFFLDETGCVWACGSNGQGHLGLSDMSVRSVFQPCQIVQSQSMQNIAAGARHSLFVDVEGTLWCCGDNTNNIFGITTHKHVHLLQKIEDVPRIRMNCQHRSVKSRVGRNSVGNLWQFSNRNPMASKLQFLVILITKDYRDNYHPTPNFQTILSE